MELPKRKSTRLKGYDYSENGAYFITICVKNRAPLLSEIVGDGVLDVPKNELTKYGSIAEKYIRQMSEFYENVSVDKFVIMPNHIHAILYITDKKNELEHGTSRTPSPTNSTISGFVSTFKRFCNKEYSENIWQRSFHDHIIRGERDYKEIWEYIDTNVLRWQMDDFYIAE